MTKLIAILALTVIAIGIQFGNYWFTFGLWPKSWAAFVGFALASMIVTACMQTVIRNDGS